MSVNWVMLSDTEGFVRLPGERILYTSPPRTALSLQSPQASPGVQPLSISSNAGTAYLTNQRIVYLPTSPVPALRSFSAPVMNLHDTHVAAPFFGPNNWRAVVQPVPGGGIPATQSLVELKMTFKEGGAFDFHSNFERIKERLRQAIQVARDRGQLSGDGSETGNGRGGGALSGLNMSAIDLEQLPAYEEARDSATPALLVSPVTASAPEDSLRPSVTANEASGLSDGPPTSSEIAVPPTEPPPEYEEVQRTSVADELERRLRQ
ncbi:MAG: hypothetical protein M1815_006100 [Lichina confinis]|nr:MAG: hypothetical protein M1815_006100 [Lichina confinis]